MDWGSLAGVVLALAGVLVAHLLDGGHLGSLVQPAAFVVVVIGTIGAVLLQNRVQVFVMACGWCVGYLFLRWITGMRWLTKSGSGATRRGVKAC